LNFAAILDFVVLISRSPQPSRKSLIALPRLLHLVFGVLWILGTVMEWNRTRSHDSSITPPYSGGSDVIGRENDVSSFCVCRWRHVGQDLKVSNFRWRHVYVRAYVRKGYRGMMCLFCSVKMNVLLCIQKKEKGGNANAKSYWF
jgi:hypothetical protein